MHIHRTQKKEQNTTLNASKKQIRPPMNIIGLESDDRASIREILSEQTLQPKLKISAPNDKYEQEANRVAEEVVRKPDPQVQRKSMEEERKEILIQTKSSPDVTLSVSPKIEKLISKNRENGQKLDSKTQSRMENSMGRNFSDVRIHTDMNSDVLNKGLGSRAFTTGQDIFFRQGEYSPGNSKGDELIAHELVHVVQQGHNRAVPCFTIQRWGSGRHREITMTAIMQIFKNDSDFQLDFSAANQLASWSADMDLKIPELWFNFIALLMGSPSIIVDGPEGPMTKKLSEKESIERLQEHYKGNEDRARNHGEGGLYVTPESIAKVLNRYHQEKYISQAIRAAQDLNQRFRTTGECEATKTRVKKNVFSALGDALHIAQDRGSHGEGAHDAGHANEILTGKSPDKKGNNRLGYAKAELNTVLVLRNLYAILRQLLNTRYSKTLTYYQNP